MYKTVGELKKFLETLPDNMPIAHYNSNMERSGYFEGIWPDVRPMIKVEREAWDAFDHEHYTYECYEHDNTGRRILLF